MDNISRGTVDGQPVATLGPELDSPDCTPQPGPVPGDHPGWEPGDDSVTPLMEQVTARDELIAKLIRMVEDGTNTMNCTTALLALANGTIAQVRADLQSARTRIVELEAALR